MNSKRLKAHFLLTLTFCIIWNSFFVDASSALTYSNPSTTPLWSYSTGNQRVSGVEISDDGAYIAATSKNLISHIDVKANGTLYFFNNSFSEEKRPLWNYSIVNSFSCVAISANGSSIAAGSAYGNNKVYFFNNSNPIPRWTYNTGDSVSDIEITDDESFIAASSQGGKVFLFNKNGSTPISVFGTTGLTLRVALSSNGNYMAVTDNDAKLYFFNISNPTPIWNFTLIGQFSAYLSISADGNYIAAGGSGVNFFRKNSPIPIWTYNTSDMVGSIKVSKDGNYIVVGGGHRDHNVYLFNRSNPIPEWIYSTSDDIASVAISYNGDYVVALGGDNFVYLFNKSSSVPIWRYRLDGHPTSNYDYSLSISSDGKYIVAGGRHRIYLFDRDSIKAPVLVIPGYNLFFMFFIVGITLFINIITAFLYINKKCKETISIRKKLMLNDIYL